MNENQVLGHPNKVRDQQYTACMEVVGKIVLVST
jgi:hypothetical protein